MIDVPIRERLRVLAGVVKALPHGSYVSVTLGDSPAMADAIAALPGAAHSDNERLVRHVCVNVEGVDFGAWRKLTVDEVRARHEREIAEASR